GSSPNSGSGFDRRQGFASEGWRRVAEKEGVLLQAQFIAQPTGRNLDVVVVQYAVPRDIPPKPTSFGETDGKQALGVNDVCVLAQAVSHVMAEPVHDLSSLEVPLRSSDHVDARSALRRDRGVSEDGGTGNRERHFKVTKVIRPIETVE